jgi:hypothetical protein
MLSNLAASNITLGALEGLNFLAFTTGGGHRPLAGQRGIKTAE